MQVKGLPRMGRRPTTEGSPGPRKVQAFRLYDTYTKKTTSLSKFRIRTPVDSSNSRVDPDSYLSHDRATENELDSRVLIDFIREQTLQSRENNRLPKRYA